MKTHTLLSALVLLSGSGMALAGDTAYEALRSLNTKMGADASNRIVEVSGQGGRPQPSVWRVVVEDASKQGGLVEIDFQGNRPSGQRKVPGSGSAPKLNMNALQMDSDGAFDMANREAVRANLSFDRLNYSLKPDNFAGFPVWSVELFDGPTTSVGSLKIAADTGAVIERSPQLALSEEQKRDSKWSKPGEKFKSVPDFFHRSGKKIQQTGIRMKNWFNGDGWVDQSQP